MNRDVRLTIFYSHYKYCHHSSMGCNLIPNNYIYSIFENGMQAGLFAVKLSSFIT